LLLAVVGRLAGRGGSVVMKAVSPTQTQFALICVKRVDPFPCGLFTANLRRFILLGRRLLWKPAGGRSVGVEVEACSGLMWIADRSVPWTCWADTHVYNVTIGLIGWSPPGRPGLRWLAYRSESDALHHVHIKVRDDKADATVFKLDVDGRMYDDLERLDGL
jgi:hypothetical protein